MAKLYTLTHTIVLLPGFNLDMFFEPILSNPTSPHHVSPYSLVTEMPRGSNTKESAFFQVGITRKENTIQGMCVPSLANLAPTYARMAVHYVVACLKKSKERTYYPGSSLRKPLLNLDNLYMT
eukprot:1801916-Ditylum_brightwellii.AAC.1